MERATGATGGDGRVEIMFKGDLSLYRSLVLKEELEKALQSEEVTVSFGEVKSVDLSFLQILCSARKSALLNGKTLLFRRENLPGSLIDLAKIVGLDLALETGVESEEERS